MSNSENTSLWKNWKKKSEIDYIPLFIPLWLSLNAWLRDQHTATKDRDLIEYLKDSGSRLEGEFRRLITGADPNSETFKSNFIELYHALENASIMSRGNKISFEKSIFKIKGQHNKIEILPDLYIDADTNRLFRAYIENLYQVRCCLFHGNLNPEPKNERVIEICYLTLSTIMRNA